MRVEMIFDLGFLSQLSRDLGWVHVRDVLGRLNVEALVLWYAWMTG